MPEDVTWENPFSVGYVLVHGDLLLRLGAYRQSHSDAREAGGLLIGYRRGPHMEIVDATVPLERDRRRRTFFDRRDPGHARYMLKVWAQSDRTMDYLGEWHTHPEAMPTPSSIDTYEWRRLLKTSRSPLAFLILGTDGLWFGCGSGRLVKQCTLAL